jgi:hypothetical protein
VFNRPETGNFMGMQHFDAAAAAGPETRDGADTLFHEAAPP